MSVFSLVSAGKVLQKVKPRVDNSVFRLHYRFSFLIFLTSSLFTTAKEFFGSPIMCEGRSGDINGAMLNTYCFIMSTFSIPSYYNRTVGDYVAYHGLGTQQEGQDLTYHSYYLWVPFLLCLQAILFYIPHFMWKKLDQGMFEVVMSGLHLSIIKPEDRKKKYKNLIRYMLTYLHQHTTWAWGFFICEALNLVNVVGNMYFIDYFLGGTFLTYGADVINFPEADSEMRVDPMTRIFPKITKCTFRKYGASGTLEIHDSICILPVNIINEKIYIFLWFWMISLTAVTALWLLFRVAIIISRTLRNKMLGVRGRWAGPQNLKIIADKCDLGDWFLVYQLGVHMEPGVYGEFLKDFAKELEDSQATLQRKPMLMKQ